MIKTKILILEDNLERISFFEKHLKLKYSGVELFFTDSIQKAKSLFIKHNGFNIYYLDHDLDNRVFVDSNEENTGYQFAKFLRDNGVTGEKEKIIIHSYNPVGALNMATCFKFVNRIPFPCGL